MNLVVLYCSQCHEQYIVRWFFFQAMLFDSNGYQYTRKVERRRPNSLAWRCCFHNPPVYCKANVIFSKGKYTPGGHGHVCTEYQSTNYEYSQSINAIQWDDATTILANLNVTRTVKCHWISCIQAKCFSISRPWTYKGLKATVLSPSFYMY